MAEATMTDQDEAAAAAATDEDGFEYPEPEGRSDDGEAVEQPKKTLAELAAEAPESEDNGDDGDDDPQPQLFGTERKVTASVKGPKPKTSHVSFSTAEVEVSGQFGGEDLIEVRAVLELTGVGIKYRRKGGQIVDTRRVHQAKAIRVEQLSVPPELLRARAQYVADALGVDVDELVAAQERAVTAVALPE